MSQNISHKIRQFDEIYIYIAISLEKFVKLHQVNLTRYFYIAISLEKFVKLHQVNLTRYFYIAILLEKFVKLYKVNLTSYFQTSQFFKYETFSRFFLQDTSD